MRNMAHNNNECPYFLGLKITEDHKTCANNCADIAENCSKYKAIVDEIMEYEEFNRFTVYYNTKYFPIEIADKLREILEKHGVK